jgi:hypothetical protein
MVGGGKRDSDPQVGKRLLHFNTAYAVHTFTAEGGKRDSDPQVGKRLLHFHTAYAVHTFTAEGGKRDSDPQVGKRLLHFHTANTTHNSMRLKCSDQQRNIERSLPVLIGVPSGHLVAAPFPYHMNVQFPSHSAELVPGRHSPSECSLLTL